MVVAGGERGVGPGRDPVKREKNVVFLFLFSFILYFNFVYAFGFNIGKREPVGRKNCAVFCYFWNFTVERRKGDMFTL
jgi:hypothetical protein